MGSKAVGRAMVSAESYVRAHEDDGVPCVEYTMTAEVARAVADLMDAEARRTNDSGYREDAAALYRAADEADAL